MSEQPIFISYSRKDTDQMRHVCAILRDAGLNVWTDENLIPGTPSWKKTIEKTIESARCVIVLMSPDAKESTWIEREINYSLLCGIPVFPALLRGDERTAIPFDLINMQYVDLRTRFEAGVQQLGEVVAAVVEGSAPPISSSSTHVVAPTGEGSAAGSLDPWNLLDQFRLFYALLCAPGRLGGWDAESVKRTGFWLVSTLAWLPLVLPVVGFALGSVTLPDETYPNSFRISASVGLSMIVGWVFAGWLGRWRGNAISLLAAAVAGAMAFVMFTVLGYFNVTFGHTGTLASLLLSISLGTAAAIAYAVAFTAAPSAAGIPSGLLLSAVLYGAVSGNEPGSAGGIAGAALIVVGIGVGITLGYNVKRGRMNALSWAVAGAVALHYAALLWLYFLGGWGVLLGMPL